MENHWSGKKQAKQYTIKLMGIDYIAIIALSIVLTVFAKPIISLYNLSPESADLAFKLILFQNVCVSTIWPLAFTLPNSFRASSDVKYTMTVSIISMWVFRVAFSYIFALWFDLGVLGVWYAMFADWSCRGLLFLFHFIRGKWQDKYVPLKVNR